MSQNEIHSTRDSCCWITRQNWMALRLAAHADKNTPEEIVDGLITAFLSTRPEIAAAVKKYQESKAAAWKEAEKSTQPKAVSGA